MQVVHEVFGRIEDKVATNRDKLISVNNRINAAKAKVDGIVGSKKATQVFSSAKYPGPAALVPFAPVYQGVERQEVPHEFHPEIDSRIGKGTPEEMESKLQFFSIDFQAKYGVSLQITCGHHNPVTHSVRKLLFALHSPASTRVWISRMGTYTRICHVCSCLCLAAFLLLLLLLPVMLSSQLVCSLAAAPQTEEGPGYYSG